MGVHSDLLLMSEMLEPQTCYAAWVPRGGVIAGFDAKDFLGSVGAEVDVLFLWGAPEREITRSGSLAPRDISLLGIPDASRSIGFSAVSTGTDFPPGDHFLLGESLCGDVWVHFFASFLEAGSLVTVLEVEPLSETADGNHWPGGVLVSGLETGLRDFSTINSLSWRSLAFHVLAVNFLQCGHFWAIRVSPRQRTH